MAETKKGKRPNLKEACHPEFLNAVKLYIEFIEEDHQRLREGIARLEEENARLRKIEAKIPQTIRESIADDD